VQPRSGADWLAAEIIATGSSRVRLWQPHRCLTDALKLARTFWLSLAGRRAIDLACGTGRDAVYLALSGFDVDACDVLPDALERCRAMAARHDVAISAFECDLEGSPRLSVDRYDLVSCFNFLHRPLFPQIAAALAAGGLVVYETFVDPQRARFGKPSREAHVLKRGELKAAFANLDVLVYREGLAGPRRCAATLIARKRADA
jgi:SAM-dependent methyltransferase